MPSWVSFVRYGSAAICIAGAVFAVFIAVSGAARGDAWPVVAAAIIGVAVFGFWRFAVAFTDRAARLQH